MSAAARSGSRSPSTTPPRSPRRSPHRPRPSTSPRSTSRPSSTPRAISRRIRHHSSTMPTTATKPGTTTGATTGRATGTRATICPASGPPTRTISSRGTSPAAGRSTPPTWPHGPGPRDDYGWQQQHLGGFPERDPYASPSSHVSQHQQRQNDYRGQAPDRSGPPQHSDGPRSPYDQPRRDLSEHQPGGHNGRTGGPGSMLPAPSGAPSPLAAQPAPHDRPR